MTTDRAQSHTHVRSCVIQSPKGAGDPVPIDGHTEIQNVAHPGSGVLVSPEKGKGLPTPATAWTNAEDVVLSHGRTHSERSYSWEAPRGLRVTGTHSTRWCRAREVVGGSACNGDQVSVREDDEVLQINDGDGYVSSCVSCIHHLSMYLSTYLSSVYVSIYLSIIYVSIYLSSVYLSPI